MRVQTAAGFLIAMMLSLNAGAVSPATRSAAKNTSTPTTSTTNPLQAIPPATLVTLHLHGAPAADAIKQLFSQADLPLTLEPFARRSIQELHGTIDVEKQPFLVVLKELCRQCDLEPSVSTIPGQRIGFHTRRPTSRSTTLPILPMRPFQLRMSTTSHSGKVSRFATRPFSPFAITTPTTSSSAGAAASAPTTMPSWVDAPSYVFGPFMVAPRDAIRSSFISGDDLTAPPRQSLRLVLVTMVDPKVLVYSIAYHLNVLTAEDSDGESLIVSQNQSREIRRNDEPETWQWTTEVSLLYPKAPGGRLKLLRGTIDATVITRTTPLTLEPFDKPLGPREAADVHLVFGKLTNTSPMQSALSFTVPREGRDVRSWEDLRATLGAASLVQATDETGRRLWVNHNWKVMGRTQLEGELYFHPLVDGSGSHGPARPAKIVWNIPVEVSDVAIPIEFKDLPLP